MKNDEMTFAYYAKHCENDGNKSFPCKHNEFLYCNGMKFDEMSIWYDDGELIKLASTIGENGKGKSNTNLYLQFIKHVGRYSENTLQRFLTYYGLDKTRVFTEEQYKSFDAKKRTATRADRGKISINGENYYASINLNITEFLKTISDRIPDEEKSKFIIKVSGWKLNNGEQNSHETDLEKAAKTVVDKEENEELEFDIEDDSFSLNIVEDVFTGKTDTRKKKKSNDNTKMLKIDFIRQHENKMKKGEVGENLVLKYERERLTNVGREDLAEKVKIVSDNVKLGYDIVSFTEDGEEMHIEVKTSTKNCVDGFYISANELSKAKGLRDSYYIYRVYNLKKNKANLHIYKASFDDMFEFRPVSYSARLRK